MWEPSLNPPDPDEPVEVCPVCGAELYDGDKKYIRMERGYEVYLGCENCIEDFAEYVEADYDF